MVSTEAFGRKEASADAVAVLWFLTQVVTGPSPFVTEFSEKGEPDFTGGYDNV